MFNDPEPVRKRHSSGAGFFSSQRPIDNPRNNHGSKYARHRQPLHERSPSKHNEQQQQQQTPDPVPGSPTKTTVRIVKQSPTLSAAASDSHLKNPAADKNNDFLDESARDEHDRSSAVVKPANVRDPGFQVSAAAAQDKSVSETPSSTNEAQTSVTDRSNALLASSIHAGANAPSHRRSGSWGNFSTSSTLKEGDSSYFGGSRSRLSLGTTLRGTPTPYDQEQRECIEEDEASIARAGPAQALQTLEETSPERSTVRVVPASLRTESSQPELHHSDEATQSSPIVRREASPSTDSQSKAESPATRSSKRTSSTGSLPTAANLRDTSVIHYPQTQRSQDSLSPSEASLPPASSPNFAVFRSEPSTLPPSSVPPSSPNFVAYYSESSRPGSRSHRPRSRSHPLHAATSQDSIASRLYQSSRPGTGTRESPEASSSTDTLPPLQVPKKRRRHQQASLSVGSLSHPVYSQGGNMVTEEEIDTLPYPRHQFSSHLSTIASESDRNSRTSSQPLSHFSLGSGVLTGDDSSSIPLSSTRRRGSAPIESVVYSDQAPGTSSGEGNGEEAGDMTLGIFREESAKPQPLFKRSGSLPGRDDRKFDGPLPPIPPIPPSRESDENFDTVSELQSPPLKEQRSGYSLRTRSNSTPSRSQSRKSNSHSRHLSQVSYIESDRGSHGSSIFPAWAKQFYKYNIPVMSASKVSLTGYPPQAPQRPGQSHLRNDSTWTERSITSRLGTGYSEIESSSPTSSHFLPSIFRPRTRGRSNTGGGGGKKLQKSKMRPSQDTTRPDSMAIAPITSDQGQETTEAGHPKYGALKDTSRSPSRPPLPRKYSKQKQWNEMTFPRPMTKDLLSDFGIHDTHDPHLGPSKRVSNRLSVWRAPSFVESLDTLVRSRTNRQILLFAVGFVFPFAWMLGAVLPIPRRPVSEEELGQVLGRGGEGGSEEDVAAAMMKHEAGDAEKRWREERMWLKGRWWRALNRIMSLVGVLVLGAVVSFCFAFMPLRVLGDGVVDDG